MIPKSLTLVERLILSNQNTILSLLDKRQYNYYRTPAEIAEVGYEGLYCELFENIFTDPVPYEVCEETLDILDMFRVIDKAISSLTPDQKSDIELNKIQFEGFDANNDKHYYFMKFLIDKMERYEELKGMDFNSHSSSSIVKYRKMFEVYNRKKKDGIYELSYDDLKNMINSI